MQTIPSTVAAIHDLSGVGRCSLSVISPVLSVMGVQCVPIPTAVLSTHTGGFSNISFRDLTEYLLPTLNQYKELDIDFNCIYTGFLASDRQIDFCNEFIHTYKHSLIVVDPVMGDNGKVYKTYTKSMCDGMIKLVKNAKLITPNKTEMYILLGKEFDPRPLTYSEIKTYLLKLAELGPDYILITGAEMSDMTICNIAYDKTHNMFWKVKCNYMPISYPGTGDIFTSVVVGSMLNGDSLPIAMERATRFLEVCIRTTFSFKTDPRYGILLESSLSWLFSNHYFDKFELF